MPNLITMIKDFSEKEWEKLKSWNPGIHRFPIMNDSSVDENESKIDIFLYHDSYSSWIDVSITKQKLREFQGYLVIADSHSGNNNKFWDNNMHKELTKMKAIIWHDDAHYSAKFLEHLSELQYMKLPRVVKFYNRIPPLPKLKTIRISTNTILQNKSFQHSEFALINLQNLENIEFYGEKVDNQLILWETIYPFHRGLHPHSPLYNQLMEISKAALPSDNHEDIKDIWSRCSNQFITNLQYTSSHYTPVDVFFYHLLRLLHKHKAQNTQDQNNVDLYRIEIKDQMKLFQQTIKSFESQPKTKTLVDVKGLYLKRLSKELWSELNGMNSGFRTLVLDGKQYDIFLYDTTISGEFDNDRIKNFTGTIITKPGCSEVRPEFTKETNENFDEEDDNELFGQYVSNSLQQFENAKSVLMCEDVVYLHNYAFYGCKKLEFIGFSSNIIDCGDYIFNSEKLEVVYIPSGIRLYGYCIFQGCENLKCLLTDQRLCLDNTGLLINPSNGDIPFTNFKHLYRSFSSQSPIHKLLADLSKPYLGLSYRDRLGFFDLQDIHKGKGYDSDHDESGPPSLVDGLWYNLLYSGCGRLPLHQYCCDRQNNEELKTKLFKEVETHGLAPFHKEDIYGMTPFDYISSNLSIDFKATDVLNHYILVLLGQTYPVYNK